MKEETYDHLVKVLMIGESGVGKTCIIQRFNRNEFSMNHLSTIAIDFKMKLLDVDGVKIKMQIWDTAGQERFNTLTTGFFKGSDGIILCYSVTDEKSFESINKWMNQINSLAPVEVKVVLVGNKVDLEKERRVSYEEGELKRPASREQVPTAFLRMLRQERKERGRGLQQDGRGYHPKVGTLALREFRTSRSRYQSGNWTHWRFRQEVLQLGL